MSKVQQRVDEIERMISSGEMNAHQVFTQMLQLIPGDVRRIGPLTKAGQIRKGDTLHISNDGMTEFRLVEEVKHQGDGAEEVILDGKNNPYFITSIYLNGKSWVKDVEIVYVGAGL